jgi:GT2 family glycosyltransferase
VTPRVSAVVVSYNAREHLLRCLAALEAQDGETLEIVVVDNASADGSAAAARAAHPKARVVDAGVNLGFARACNLGVREAQGPYVLILNPDAEVRPGCVAALAHVLDERPRVAVVGPRTLSGDGTAQVSFGEGLTPLAEWRQQRLVRGVRLRRADALRQADERARVEREPGWISGSCLLARRSALTEIGGFDEAFFLYEEDVDLCVRLRDAGWHVAFTPSAEVVHHLGVSMASDPWRSQLEYHRSHLRFYRKHNGWLQTALLRCWIAASALPGRPASVHWRSMLGLALHGR